MPREIKVTDESRVRISNKIRPGHGIHGSGTVVHIYKSLKPSKSKCSGCRDNYYNSSAGMNGECWMFKDAVVVDKIGHAHINVCGGPDTKMKKTLDCWHAVRK